MRIRIEELNLLVEVYKHLNTESKRKDLASDLLKVIDHLNEQLETERQGNKARAEANRKNGYRWESSHHPKKSKYMEGNTK